jgi:hypothetical protein
MCLGPPFLRVPRHMQRHVPDTRLALKYFQVNA